MTHPFSPLSSTLWLLLMWMLLISSWLFEYFFSVRLFLSPVIRLSLGLSLHQCFHLSAPLSFPLSHPSHLEISSASSLERSCDRFLLNVRLWSPLLHSRVKYAVNTLTGQPVAVKILDKTKIKESQMEEQIKKEVRLPPIDPCIPGDSRRKLHCFHCCCCCCCCCTAL